MKIRLLLLAFLSYSAYAAFLPGTIRFNDGHSQTGFVSEILTGKRIDMDGFSSFLQKLNLDQKFLKFKASENATPEKVSIDDINEVALTGPTGIIVTYKPIYVRDLNIHGQVKEGKKKVFLPYVRRGKVNIFGFTYRYSATDNSGTHARTVLGDDVMFYYQNASEDYAFDYYDIGFLDLIYMRERLSQPLETLFKDCPELVADVHTYFVDSKNLSKEDKRQMAEDNKKLQAEMDKDYDALPDYIKYGNLSVLHQYQYKMFDDYLQRYETDCK